MDFESPDVEKDFPGLYASDPLRQSQERESDYSDDSHEKPSKKELLIGKRKERKESKKDKGYVAFEEESSGGELDIEQKSPTKSRKSKSAFKFSKRDKSKEKNKEKKEEKKEEKEKEKKKEKRVKLKLKDLKKSKHTEDDNEKDDRIIFGVPLHVAVDRSKCHDGIELPAIVRECIDYIEEHGLSCEGIYRLSGVKSKVQKLKNQYNRGEQVCLYEHEPHIVASLLKLYLRELPDPVLTHELMPKFEDACSLKDANKRIELLRKLIDDLPTCNGLLLSWIFVHMGHIIQRENVNKMSVQNVSIVLSPTMQISHRVLNILFMHGSILFKDVCLKKYVPPLKPEMSRSSLELPDSPSAIQDEILKQESLLSQLHADMFSGVADREKEEQLWEVQRIVTQLKRKLRLAKRAQDVEKDDERAAAPSLPQAEDLEIDTRLQTVPQQNTSSLQVNTDHKCTVFVPWQAATSETNKDVGTVLPEEEMAPIKTEIVVVSEHQDATLHQNSLNDNSGEVASMDSVVLKNRHDEDEKKESAEIIYSSSKDSTNGDVCISQDVGIPEDNCEIQQLISEEQVLRVQHEELSQLSGELRRKIETERYEVERLKTKIQELRVLYRYHSLSCDSAENSSDEDCSDSEDDVGEDEEEEDTEESLQQTLFDLQEENKSLEHQNEELIERIQVEREACLEAKIQIRLLQLKQEEALNQQHGKTKE